MRADEPTISRTTGVEFGLHPAIVALAAITLFAVGCGETTQPKKDMPEPRIQKLDNTKYRIGEEFVVRGDNFLTSEGETKLHFKGEFIGANGETRPVDFTAPLKVTKDPSGEGYIGKWLRFGPMTNPFTDQPTTGRFEGEITPVNVYVPEDGEEVEALELRGVPSQKGVEVQPSLEIVRLQPKSADCGAPAMRGLPGLPYEIQVRAVGFAPSKFEWRISAVQQGKSLDTYQYFSHQATGPTDTLGDDEDEEIIFQDVPPNAKYYVAGIEVRATDQASGKKVVTSLPYSIHRPIEIHYSGELEVAEHYPPKPVTACIPGTINGTASYSEQTTEAKQRGASVSISENWAKSKMRSTSKDWQIGYGISETSSQTVSQSQSQSQTETTSQTSEESYNESTQNSFERETSKGERWHHENEVGAKGSTEVGVPMIGNAEVEVSGGRRWGKATTKETGKSWGETVSQGKSESFSNSYSLAKSTSSSRSISDTESREKSKTYNYGASATSSNRVTEGMSKAEEKTWMKTKQNTTLTSYSGYIPVDKYGVFYRQTIRMIRRARLTSYNKCGVPSHMGEIHLSTWNWAPDLAVGDSCGDTLPEPNLPDAKCHIQPCD